MRVITFILILTGLISYSTCHGQNNTGLKQGYTNLATFVVDYQQYQFEGGNLAYYNCSSCPSDSIPFAIDYKPPGDFGEITFQLAPTADTVFDASIIWLGRGEINQPNNFHQQPPFVGDNSITNKPANLRYIERYGLQYDIPDFKQKADSAWTVIDNLSITHAFAKHNYQAAIYLYPPAVGAFDPRVAKWIIFLYANDVSSSGKLPRTKENTFDLYPNPTEGELTIHIRGNSSNIREYRIHDAKGQLKEEGQLHDNLQRLSLRSLSPGLYHLTIGGPKEQVVSKSIVIH